MTKEIVYRKLSDLKKLPNNPRTIKKDDMERLKKSIKDNPVRMRCIYKENLIQKIPACS